MNFLEIVDMNKITKILTTVLFISLTGCAGLSDTQQRGVTGGLGGAAGGAVIGAIAGNAGMGALIGGAAGSAGGFLFGKHKESEQRAYEQGRRDAQYKH
jgi:Glycine zipper